MASGYEKKDCGVEGGQWNDEAKRPRLRDRLGAKALFAVAIIVGFAPAVTSILQAFN